MVFLRIFITLFIVFTFFSCNNEDKNSQPSVSLASVEVLEGNTNNDLEITLSLTNVVNYDLAEIVKGDSIFCATGITTGDLVSGVEIKNGKYVTETLVTHKNSSINIVKKEVAIT